MWLSFLANYKSKSGNSLVLVVFYCLVFILNVCHSSENVTSNAVIPNLSKSDNSSSSETQRPLTKLIKSTTSPFTIAVKETTTIASILEKLSPIPIKRPNVTINNSNSTSTNGIYLKNASIILNTEKVNISRTVRPKQKQPTIEQKQQQQLYKISSWPSKPTGTYLIEGNILKILYINLYYYILVNPFSISLSLTLFVFFLLVFLCFFFFR